GQDACVPRPSHGEVHRARVPGDRTPARATVAFTNRSFARTATVLFLIAIFLLTAVVVVPLFRRLKLGSVLGYIAAGVLIAPWGLGLVPQSEGTQHAAELGVVLLLFLVGLELEPSRLWALRRPVFGFGAAQVLVRALAVGAITAAMGLSWQASVIAGAGLAMSSTALVLSSL